MLLPILPMNIEPSRQFRKTDLRKRIRRERALLAPGQRQTWDSEVNSHLLHYVGYTQPRVVAAFLAFDGPLSSDRYRTAVVFHEADPRALRDRFSEFDAHALGAFLRSSLP